MTQPDRQYRPDIDGLRAIAVGVVMLFHAFPARLPGGFVGVDVFFVLSGYLISGIILKAHASGRFSFAEFYARRIRRIFPALAIVLTAVLIGGWFLLYADDYARVGRHTAAGAAFFSNFAIWQESSYFDVASDLKPLLHLWSLGVEEQFYFVWPVLLIAAARWRRGPVIATLLVGTISFLLAIYTVRIDRTPAFFAPWNRFWELLAGALLASVHADATLDAWLQRWVSRQMVVEALAAAGLLAIVAGVSLIDSQRVFPGLWVLLPVGGAAVLVLTGPRAWVNRAILSQRLLVWIGLISYPLYLWHWPLLSFAHIRYGDIPPTPLRLALLATSMVLAWATYQLVERRVRFGKHGRLAVPVLCALMVCIGAAGYAVYAHEGLIDRPVNRNDGARLVDYYERLRKTGLGDAYRLQCDYLDARTQGVRAAIDPSCTAAGSAHTVFLWGDSFAQALSLGIRESLPADTSLAQVATSTCRAEIENFDTSSKGNICEITNRFAMQSIERLHPDVVIIAQAGNHTVTDWPKVTARALALGAKQVIVVGPFPMWQPSLPRVYAERHMTDHADYVGTGLNTTNFDIDRTMASRVSGLAHVTFVSLLDQLCPSSRADGSSDTGRACLGRVPGEGALDLMTLDFGHLTPKGSSYLGRVIWTPYFNRTLRSANNR